MYYAVESFTEIDKERRVINVEWMENSETKAKVIDVDDLLSVNPGLVAAADKAKEDSNEYYFFISINRDIELLF